MYLLPALLTLGDPLEVGVVDLQESRLLQVRHGDAPAALQVEVEPEGNHVPQSLGRCGGQARRQVGLACVHDGLQGEGVGDPGGQLLVRDTVRARVDGGPVQRPAQFGYLDEVVEVAGLEGGVLPVVDEGEELARRLGKCRLRHTVQRAHDGCGDQ